MNQHAPRPAWLFFSELEQDKRSYLEQAEAFAFQPLNRETMYGINQLLSEIEHARQFRKDALTSDEIAAREKLKGYIAQFVNATEPCPCCGGTGKAGMLP